MIPVIRLLNVLKAASEEASGENPEVIFFISPGAQTLTLVMLLLITKYFANKDL